MYTKENYKWRYVKCYYITGQGEANWVLQPIWEMMYFTNDTLEAVELMCSFAKGCFVECYKKHVFFVTVCLSKGL